MQYSYTTLTCPECKQMLYIKITKILWFIRVTSGLGPNSLICASCKTRIAVNTKEWNQMNFREKLWYFVLSMVYGLLLGMISATSGGLIFESVLDQRFTVEMAGVYIVAPITLTILFIQLIRIQTSLKRTKGISFGESEKEINFWNWETNLQFYGIVWVILVVLGMVPFLLS